MKKKISAILIMILICLPVFAGGIGYIDYEKIIDNYNLAKTTRQELDTKAKELHDYLTQKEEEFNQLESPVQKSKFEMQMQEEVMKRETAFNDFVKKREEAVKQRVKAIVEQVRNEKGLDAVLSEESVYSGGVDITEDVIQQLNK